jgi:integrase
LAIERKHLTSAPKIRHLSEKGNARQGFFSDAAFSAVKSFLPDYLKDFSAFAYLTGWRKGEVSSLTWEDVDGDVIRLRGVSAKNDEPRSVVLTGALAELIERRKAAREVKTENGVMLAAHVFHNNGLPVADFRKAWWSACVDAGVGMFVCPSCKQSGTVHRCPECKIDTYYSGKLFHDLRRTAIRNMVRSGVPERVAMDISGHKTRSIFDRYNITSESDLRDAMERTQNYLAANAEQQQIPIAIRQTAGSKN